jgi:hypothetical protein
MATGKPDRCQDEYDPEGSSGEISERRFAPRLNRRAKRGKPGQMQE